MMLDEPTNGLDSNEAFDIVTFLRSLSASEHTVVATIHQPRLGIFHMFNTVLFLAQGEVVYLGTPFDAASAISQVRVCSMQCMCFLLSSPLRTYRVPNAELWRGFTLGGSTLKQ